jgi:hypothetical protein
MIVLLVVVNTAIVGWLLLRPETAPSATLSPQANVIDDLLKDNTMEAARYDLSDSADTLNVILISLDSPQTSMPLRTRR